MSVADDPKVTFRVDGVAGSNDPLKKAEIHYTIIVHHVDGSSEYRGKALLGENIHVTEGELVGD